MQLDIRNLKTYVISLADAKARRSKVKGLLDGVGVKDVTFYDAIDVRGKFPYWIGCGMSHREVLAQAEYPCVIYEDDIAKTEWFVETVDVPEDSIVYLGISRWGTRNGNAAVGGVSLAKSEYDGVLRVQYMLSTHAIYYPSEALGKAYANGISRHMLQRGRPLDEWFAFAQTALRVHCLRRPLFYQECERNERWTRFQVNDDDILR
jgi:hypothetical protein